MDNRTITIHSTVTRNNKDFISSMVGDEVVMMGMESGKYVGLNNVGSVIWKLIEKPIQVREIVTNLVGTYAVTKEKCEQQVLQFLEKIKEQDMLIIIE